MRRKTRGPDNVIQSGDLCVNAERQGLRLLRGLSELCAQCQEVVSTFTGRGLLLGVHTASKRVASDIVGHCLRSGILLMPAFLDFTTILIEPPLCINDARLEEVLSNFRQACHAIHCLL